jgi:hypothetical protein
VGQAGSLLADCQPDRLVMLARIFHRGETSSSPETGQTGQIWELVRDHASLLDSAVYSDGSPGVNLFAAGHVEYVRQQRVSANLFHVLGISPFAGREFTGQEDVPDGPPLVILSYGLWQSVFHGDPHILGRTIDFRGAPFTVIGIMPAHFRTDVRADLWTPLHPSTTGEGGGSNYTILARLKPGVTFAAANAQHSIAGPLIRDLEKRMPQDISLEVDAIPLQVGRTADIRSKVEIILGRRRPGAAHRLRKHCRPFPGPFCHAGARGRHAHRARRKQFRGHLAASL